MVTGGATMGKEQANIWDWHSALSPMENLEPIALLEWINSPTFKILLPDGTKPPQLAEQGQLTLLKDRNNNLFVRSQAADGIIDFLFTAEIIEGKLVWSADYEDMCITNMLIPTSDGWGGLTLTTEGSAISWTPKITHGELLLP